MLFEEIFHNALDSPPNTHDIEEGSRDGMTCEIPHDQLGLTQHYFSHFASFKSDSGWALVAVSVLLISKPHEN